MNKEAIKLSSKEKIIAHCQNPFFEDDEQVTLVDVVVEYSLRT